MFLLAAFVALVATLAAVYLVARVGERSRIKRALVLVGLVPTAAFGFVAALHDAGTPEIEIRDRPIEARPAEFVSSRACQICHPSEYASWDASYHQSMTQVASPSTVQGDFDNVELRQGRYVFRLQRRGDEFWVDMPDIDWSTQGPFGPRVQRKVVLTTGSHHMQAYWYSSGNSRVVGVLPFVYNLQLERWLPRGASFLTPPVPEPVSELGRWNKTCIECHVTLGRLRPFEPDGNDTHVVEFGIACESCHGPAAAHVAGNRSPIRRYSKHLTARRDPNIVQPARLRHDRGSEVCGQCHSTSIWTSQEAIDDWMKNGFRYRPGDRLADSKAIVRGKLEWNPPAIQAVLKFQPDFLPDTFWPDGMNRVTGREYNGLLETPCFQRGEMSCLSCHDIHKADDDPRSLLEWADDQLKPGMRGNVACTQCHAEYTDDEKLRSHTHHAAASSGSNCYNCHMPHTTYGLLKAVRSHQIDSPSVQSTLATRRPNACNQCHLDRTLAWTADHLQRWYHLARPALSQDETEVAASLLSLLRGDAGERALAAWSMAWKPALEASGTGWQGPYLGILAADPYDAVRTIAYRSAQRLSELEGATSDSPAPRQGTQILIDPTGAPMLSKLQLLLRERDDRPVTFAE